MLTAICPVPNGDHAGLNAVQDSTSQVGLLRPYSTVIRRRKSSLFSRSANRSLLALFDVSAGRRFGRDWVHSCRAGQGRQGSVDCRVARRTFTSGLSQNRT